MTDFDMNGGLVTALSDALVGSLARYESYEGITLTASEKAAIVSRMASGLEVPAIVYSPADLVGVSTKWRDDEMTDAELLNHRELAAAAYPLLPGLLQKAEPDYSVLEWALSNAKAEGK